MGSNGGDFAGRASLPGNFPRMGSGGEEKAIRSEMNQEVNEREIRKARGISSSLRELRLRKMITFARRGY